MSEQRENAKLCPKLWKSTSETFRMIKQVHDEEFCAAFQ
jgi:hypothetical protein